MADEPKDQEKTEEATPRRRHEAREKGQVPFSQELTAAGMLFAGLGVALYAGGSVAAVVGRTVSDSLVALGTHGTAEIDVPNATALMKDGGGAMLESIAWFALPLLALGLLAGYGQIGFQITPKAVEFNPGKLNPIKGLGRMFSMRSVVRTALALGKIALIGAVMAFIAVGDLGDIATFERSELGPVIAGTGKVVTKAAIAAMIVVIFLGVADLVFQRFQHGKDLRMTKQEAKEENKNLEGDPHVKSRIRQVQREMASRRMMAEVPDATVVVTNPTHYAVALKYERERDEGRAPRVVAKGTDEVAQRIKQVADENDVVLFEDVPLARALHAQCDLGDEVPEQLFEAVAGVLAYVYRVQGERASAA